MFTQMTVRLLYYIDQFCYFIIKMALFAYACDGYYNIIAIHCGILYKDSKRGDNAMTNRERVINALNHRESDIVPWGQQRVLSWGWRTGGGLSGLV